MPQATSKYVSSRMENPFMDLFSEKNRLYLHELTKSDMEKYVHGYLRCVGNQVERHKLATPITEKAQGVFLWVVLVVQKIRRQSDNGVKFPRLIQEVDSLPTELSELFLEIFDSLPVEDRRLLGQVASLLHFLSMIPMAKAGQLWLNLSDFYFLDDYAIDPRFAEDAQFPHPETENVKESKARARRRLAGACGGLVEADRAADLDFIHRSVGDFFQQEAVHRRVCDDSFRCLEALSQIKLAAIKHYWWNEKRQYYSIFSTENSIEEDVLSRHSILAACLIEQRRRQHLDSPPFTFLQCLDTISQLRVSEMMDYSLSCSKTAFRINLWGANYHGDLGYWGYEICHTSRVRHQALQEKRGGKYWNEFPSERFVSDKHMVLWRSVDEDVDDRDDYTIPAISPLFTELCSGRWEYPVWVITHLQETPLESDKLAMLVYYAIGTGIGRVIWPPRASTSHAPEADQKVLVATGLAFFQCLLDQKIVSPNLLTHLAFGGENGFIRVAAENQQLSLWQHFFCWWVTVAAVSGDYISETDPNFEAEATNDSGKPVSDIFTGTNTAEERDEPFNQLNEQTATGFVLESFIRNGADLNFRLEIKDEGGFAHGSDDVWYSYAVTLFHESGETLMLDVVLNAQSRLDVVNQYPYRVPRNRISKVWHNRASEAIPKSPITVRDWIDRSRLPNKGGFVVADR